MRLLLVVAEVLSLLSTQVMANPAENDQAMFELATNSGCMTCHTIVPAPKRADGLPPIAPAWRDIAIKYRDDPAASQRLTHTVMTGSDPNARHWAGKTGAVSMPPESQVVTEAQARVLVNWILVLVP
jgi:cytochrome c